jgi:hypothetical protein
MRLFWLFHVLRSSGERAPPSVATTSNTGPRVQPCTPPLNPGKWDHWMDDWVIMQAEVHDQLELMTAVPTASRNGRERVPNLQRDYCPMLKRIQFLVENVLTSMMVLSISCRTASPLSSIVLVQPGYTMGKMTPQGWSAVVGQTWTRRYWMECDFINPPAPCMPICLD